MNTLLTAALTLEKFDAINNRRNNNSEFIGDTIDADRCEPSAKNIHALAQRCNIAPATVAAILNARQSEREEEAHHHRRLPQQHGTFNARSSNKNQQQHFLYFNNGVEIDDGDILCDTDSEMGSIDMSLDDDEPSITNSRPVAYFNDAAAVVPSEANQEDFEQQQQDVSGQPYETLMWNPAFVNNDENNTTVADDIAEAAEQLAMRYRRRVDEQANNDVDRPDDDDENDDASVPQRLSSYAGSEEHLPRRVPNNKRLVKLLDCATHSSFMAPAGSHDLAVERVYRKLFECSGSYRDTFDALMKPLGSNERDVLLARNMLVDEHVDDVNSRKTRNSNDNSEYEPSKKTTRIFARNN